MGQGIFVGIGANLPSIHGLSPLETARDAAITLDCLPGFRLVGLSRWYQSAPIPPSGQPDYINGVAHLRGRILHLHGEIGPVEFLRILQRIELKAGRERGAANAARTLDLDIVAMDGLVRIAPDPVLPHPRAHLRAFVLLPLADVAPDWVHPVSGQGVRELIAALPEQTIRVL